MHMVYSTIRCLHLQIMMVSFTENYILIFISQHNLIYGELLWNMPLIEHLCRRFRCSSNGYKLITFYACTHMFSRLKNLEFNPKLQTDTHLYWSKQTIKKSKKVVLCNYGPACSDQTSSRIFRKYGGKYMF